MIRTRSYSVIAAVAVSIVASTAPAIGAFDAADPNPLRERTLLRAGAIAANGSTTAIGYREGGNPGQLRVAFSKDGGETYLKGTGKLRQFAVAGLGKLGISLDICDDAIWVASAANAPGDRPKDSDVIVSRRLVDGGAGQVFVTAPSRNRIVRSADVACLAKDFIAVAWLERIGGESRARLIIQDQGSLAPTAFKKSYNLGKAELGGGISVAGTADGAYVAWTKGKGRHVKYQRFSLGEGDEPTVTRSKIINIARKDASWPQVAARGSHVVVAYTDNGKVKVKTSDDGGASFSPPNKIVPHGKKATPSRAWSLDIRGDRIVVEAERRAAGTRSPVRVQSFDYGSSWQTTAFGHKGSRYGALQTVGEGSSLKEAWHHNGPSADKLRAQYEK